MKNSIGRDIAGRSIGRARLSNLSLLHEGDSPMDVEQFRCLHDLIYCCLQQLLIFSADTLISLTDLSQQQG